MNKENILSDKIRKLEESATLRMSRMATELKEAGKEVISLSLGEPDFITPKYIRDAAVQALDDGYTKYTPVSGLLELREAIKRKFLRDNSLRYNTGQIMVSNGAKQCIANLVNAVVNPGDEVILFAPYWVSYYDIVSLANAVPVPIRSGIEQDYKIRPEQLRSALSAKTKLIIFSSPCNPSGSVYTQSELEALAEVIRDTDILVISDEIYEYINFSPSHFSLGRIPSVADQTVTVNGFSKGFAMTGWRLGYMGAPEFITKACSKLQGQWTSGANAFSQKAAITALQNPGEEVQSMKQSFEKRKSLLRELLSEVEGIKYNDPQGAFYLFLDISMLIGKKTEEDEFIQTSRDLAEYFLRDAGVAMVEGSAFGMENHLRISYATSEEQLKKAIAKMKDAVEKLR